VSIVIFNFLDNLNIRSFSKFHLSNHFIFLHLPFPMKIKKIYLKEIHLHLTKNTTLSEQNQNRRRGETRYPQTRKYLIAQFPCLIQTL
jgi:hypothetical protein